MNALIGSGFYAKDLDDFNSKLEFHEIWKRNVGDRDVVIVDNSECPVPKLKSVGRTRVIQVLEDLGHVESFLGSQAPKLCGWTASWMIPAFMAYCEGRDVIYAEQDCLSFGDWEAQMYKDAEKLGVDMVFGEKSDYAVCEQSLFLIKHGFILEAIRAYLNIQDGDGVILPEAKFVLMEQNNPKRIGRHSLPGGRRRPLPINAWSAQKYTAEELTQLKTLNLI